MKSPERFYQSHIFNEYAVIIIGNIITIIIQYFVYYANYDDQYKYNNIFYFAPIYTFYLILSGYSISMTLSPLIGHFKKQSYLWFFILFSIPSGVLIYSGVNSSFSGWRAVVKYVGVLFPLPLAYLIAWHINKKYWKIKEASAS